MGERVVAMLLLSQFEPGFWVLCGDSKDCYRLGMLGLPSAALSRLSVHHIPSSCVTFIIRPVIDF